MPPPAVRPPRRRLRGHDSSHTHIPHRRTQEGHKNGPDRSNWDDDGQLLGLRAGIGMGMGVSGAPRRAVLPTGVVRILSRGNAALRLPPAGHSESVSSGVRTIMSTVTMLRLSAVSVPPRFARPAPQGPPTRNIVLHPLLGGVVVPDVPPANRLSAGRLGQIQGQSSTTTYHATGRSVPHPL